MSWLRTVSRADNESRELVISTARNVILVVGLLYMAWHFIATLGWPKIFSPSLWVSTLMMAVIVALALRLLERHYLVAQAVWLGGLVTVIVEACAMYHLPEALLLLALLPMMAVVTVGIQGTLLVELLILGVVMAVPRFNVLPGLPVGYPVGIVLSSIFSGFFGWGLSSNLTSAIDAASFHFYEARHLLEEARQHRAEISVMLKDRNQANYQLERLNQMLAYARKRADEARVDRDRFVLAVSHELRSPLNFILGFSDLMVNSPETYALLQDWPQGLYDDVQEVYRSSKHLLGLINDILDMGQIDAQQMLLFREPVRLDVVAADVQEMAGASFAQKGLYLRYQCEADLPEVLADRTRLRQVLLNLVNNSLRFTEQGGVTISIRRHTGALHGAIEALEVQVQDTGSGIAEEDAAKVFDEFRQVGVDRWRRREGSGLGLSISRRFVELHGGKMWLESQVGVGTTIYFTIPLESTVSLLQSPPDMGSMALGRSERSQPLVLLLTGDVAVLRSVQSWLSGYQVVMVERSGELLSKVVEHFPQAILVDRSPGTTALAEPSLPLKQLPYDLPVIGVILSNSALQGAREHPQALPPGVSRYLVKPVARQVLVDVVQQSCKAAIDASRRMLVVDDDPVMLRFVGQVFRSVGVEADEGDKEPGEEMFEIVTAQTADEALRILREQKVDVLLLDLDLLDRSGWDVLAHIRQGMTLSQPQVVIISALDLPQNLFVYGQVVLDVSMKRPLSAVELTGILKPILGSVQPVYPGGQISQGEFPGSSSEAL